MKSRLIASVLAAALALTAATAGPVQALDRDERNRLILGLGALAIIGALANQNRSRTQPQVTYDNHNWYDDDRRYDRRDGRYDRDRDRHSRNWLPASCEFSIRTHEGTRSVLGKSCLSQSDIRTSRLPSSCAFDIRTSRGTREVFSSRCLQQQGYRIEARR